MSDLARLLLLTVAFAGAGAAAVVLAGIPTRRAWLPTVAGLSPAVGIALCGMVSTLGAMIGIDAGLATTAVLALVTLFVAGLALRSRPGLGDLRAPSPAGTPARILELTLLIGLAVLSVRILRLAAASALDQWDGWAMWGPKAHALYVEGDVWGSVFRDPAYLMQHQEYPILLPALEALTARALGRFDPALIDIAAAAVLVAFGWAAWALLRLVIRGPAAAAVALALTGWTPLIANATANYADTVVAAFGALGIVCLFVWLTSGAVAVLLLSGVFLAATVLTKAEGLLFVVCALVAAAAVARGFGRSIRSTGIMGGCVVAVAASWAVVDRLNGPGADNVEARAFVDPRYMVDAAGRIRESSGTLLDEAVTGWPLASVAIVLALTVACLARAWWHALFVGLWAALAFSSLIVVYYASTAPADWLLTWSADRVVFTLVLVLTTVAPVLVAPALAAPRDRVSPDVDGRESATREIRAPAGISGNT